MLTSGGFQLSVTAPSVEVLWRVDTVCQLTKLFTASAAGGIASLPSDDRPGGDGGTGDDSQGGSAVSSSQPTITLIVESPSLTSVVVVYPTSPQARMPGSGARRSGPGTARWQRGRR